jgi:hypothetical protein
MKTTPADENDAGERGQAENSFYPAWLAKFWQLYEGDFVPVTSTRSAPAG